MSARKIFGVDDGCRGRLAVGRRGFWTRWLTSSPVALPVTVLHSGARRGLTMRSGIVLHAYFKNHNCLPRAHLGGGERTRSAAENGVDLHKTAYSEKVVSIWIAPSDSAQSHPIRRRRMDRIDSWRMRGREPKQGPERLGRQHMVRGGAEKPEIQSFCIYCKCCTTLFDEDPGPSNLRQRELERFQFAS